MEKNGLIGLKIWVSGNARVGSSPTAGKERPPSRDENVSFVRASLRVDQVRLS